MVNPKAGKKIAIVTGASAGLGRAFALQVSRYFSVDEIWLVARRADALQALAAQLPKAVVIPLDLKEPHAHQELRRRLEAEKASLQVLVNNAGLGKIGPVLSMGLEEQLDMIDVNVRALTALTRSLLPFIPRGGGILQVASSAGFMPSPYFAVYSATKSYAVSFSLALREELRPLGIHVTAVCPGPVATEFHGVAMSNASRTSGSDGRAPGNAIFMAEPGAVAERALRDLVRNRPLSVYGWAIRLFVWMAPFLPHGLIIRILARRRRTA